MIEEKEVVKERKQKLEEKLISKFMRMMGRIVASIVALLVIYWIAVLAKYVYYNFTVEWLGYLIIIFSAKTKILSLMFCEAYVLSDGTIAMRRVFVPYDYFGWKLKKRDSLKLNLFIYDPFFMLRTDWRHSVLPYNLNEYIKIWLYLRRIWFPFLLQISVGVIMIMGYLNPYLKEITLVWAISLFLGTLSFLPENLGAWRRKWYRSKGFPNITIPDMLYLLSMGMVYRGVTKRWRILLSLLVLIIVVFLYFYDLGALITKLIKGGETLWELLSKWVNPHNW